MLFGCGEARIYGDHWIITNLHNTGMCWTSNLDENHCQN